MTVKTLKIDSGTSLELLRRSVPAHPWQLEPRPLAIEDITRREFLIGAGSILVLAPYGCGGGSGNGGETASRGTRAVEHALGETEVPASPQRIVSLDVGEITDCLVALGRDPIGSVTYPESISGETPGYPAALAGETEDIRSVGGSGEPNLEKIASLEPDLILGFDYSGVGEIYDQLSEIAPTVVVRYVRDWKVYFRAVANAIGAGEEARRVIADYEDRTDALRKEDIGGTRVSVVRPREDVLWLYGPPSIAGEVLADLGLEVQPVPEGRGITDDVKGAIGELSLEYVPELTGDHIFVITYNLEDTSFEELVSRPLWQKHPAVQKGNVHPVQGIAWTNHGPLGANLMIDEVEKAIAENAG